MIRHIVLFRLKDKSPESIEKAVAVLRGMEGKVEGMVSLEVGVDLLRSERSCDIALCTLFTDRAALDAYQDHPVHVPVKEYMGAVRESSWSADYAME